MLKIANFIDGSFVCPIANKYLESVNPATGRVHALIPDSDKDDVDTAVASAQHAFQEWSEKPPSYRSKVMMKIADMLEERLDEFANMESEDQGKPVSLAKAVDIPRCIYNFRFFATYILHTTDDSIYGDTGDHFSHVQKVPVGVAGLISPWNLPLYLLSWKIAPAIAFGNTCVAKPSEFTSVTAWKLCQIFKEAELPPGVVNIVFGDGSKVGEAIVEHPGVPLISFTGSTVVGKRISHVVSPFCKKLSLELGGKNAAVIFDDAELDKCISVCLKSAFANQGEVCLCTSRIFVHRNIYEEFLTKFVEKVKGIKVGNPKDPSVTMGALVSKQHYDKVSGYINLALQNGGKIHCGHGVEDLILPTEYQGGFFIRPTVITDLPDSSACMQEEIFGPVTCVSAFNAEEEVIDRVNNVQYGLCASLWTSNISRAMRVSKKLNVGTVWTNCWLVRDLHMPFGGMKMSGIGRESGKDSRNFFTESKCICVKF